MNMQALTPDEIRMLLEQQTAPCISLYLPTHRTGRETQQDPLELRNVIREVEHRLTRESSHYGPIRTAQREELLKPVQALLEDEQFWLHPAEGLVILRSPNVFRTYWLPTSLKEHVIIGPHFYIKPLLPFLTNEGRYYILALSQKDIRLLVGTHYTVQEVTLPEKVPQSLADVLKHQYNENDVRHYSSSSGAAIGKGGHRAAIFYGQGAGIDDTKDDLQRYFQQINRGLRELLHNEHTPMVLAGVEYLLPIYHEVNTYPHLLQQAVPGNPDKLRAEELREKAWEVVEPYMLKTQQDDLARYNEFANTERATNNISLIVPAAWYGQVESLFVAVDREQWGRFNPDTNAIEVHEQAQAGDAELLDMAAAQTFLHGGAVYAVEHGNMPGEVLLAAVFRYA